MNKPAIFIVATPIGNLDDMTPRAIATLREADLIAAEDTRRTRQLLTHFGISGKTLVCYQDHDESRRASALLDRVESDGLRVALVSDAGTPCVADPGYRIVAGARERGIAVHPIPGASAVATLVSASGLPSDRFLFVGFLPTKKSELAEELDSWARARASVVFFEPTRRMAQTLEAIGERFPRATVAIGRELTKLHEEIVVLRVSAAIEWASQHDSLRGEATIMVDLGLDDEDQSDMPSLDQLRAEAIRAFAAGASLRELLTRFKDSGHSRGALYQMLLDAKEESER